MDYSIFSQFFIKLSCTMKLIFTKPVGLLVAVPAITMPMMATPLKALILLAVLFVVDFITGIGASWVEFRKVLPLVPASGKRYLIQSAKLKLSGLKFVLYAMMALCAAAIEFVFSLKSFDLSHISTEKLTLTTIVIGFCCGIEIWSIFFENFKRMGFDIIQKTKNIIRKGRDFYKYLTSGEEQKNNTDESK